jgi:hypothetical protein
VSSGECFAEVDEKKNAPKEDVIGLNFWSLCVVDQEGKEPHSNTCSIGKTIVLKLGKETLNESGANAARI